MQTGDLSYDFQFPQRSLRSHRIRGHERDNDALASANTDLSDEAGHFSARVEAATASLELALKASEKFTGQSLRLTLFDTGQGDDQVLRGWGQIGDKTEDGLGLFLSTFRGSGACGEGQLGAVEPPLVVGEGQAKEGEEHQELEDHFRDCNVSGEYDW